ncbi:hypothetical protein [Candidatus Phyllobacterium onerii]|uniref:hypothetical protein n=1 Tax=Candidatus Phyllobacterium onerii TaxID=3020828 RepID=UPI00232AC323|nr:hypothetical protein [Phyllobacterium sp. IY22]
MTELRDIDNLATPPEVGDWVLIERDGEKFIASGPVNGTRKASFFKPTPFDTLDQAVTASLVWAEQNEVPFVYIRAAQ